MGFIYQMEQFQQERMWACLRTLSALTDAVDMTAEYVSERRVFGRTLMENPVIHQRLADMQAQLERCAPWPTALARRSSMAWTRSG